MAEGLYAQVRDLLRQLAASPIKVEETRAPVFVVEEIETGYRVLRLDFGYEADAAEDSGMVSLYFEGDRFAYGMCTPSRPDLLPSFGLSADQLKCPLCGATMHASQVTTGPGKQVREVTFFSCRTLDCPLGPRLRDQGGNDGGSLS